MRMLPHRMTHGHRIAPRPMTSVSSLTVRAPPQHQNPQRHRGGTALRHAPPLKTTCPCVYLKKTAIQKLKGSKLTTTCTHAHTHAHTHTHSTISNHWENKNKKRDPGVRLDLDHAFITGESHSRMNICVGPGFRSRCLDLTWTQNHVAAAGSREHRAASTAMDRDHPHRWGS